MVGRFIKDNKGGIAQEYSAEEFAHWKLSLKTRGCAPETINHFTYQDRPTAEISRTDCLTRLKCYTNAGYRGVRGPRDGGQGV